MNATYKHQPILQAAFGSILLLLAMLTAGCGESIDFDAEERHHIYPKEYFCNLQDSCSYSNENVIAVNKFEHRFADTTERGAGLWLLFGNRRTDDGFHSDARNAFTKGENPVAVSRLWDEQSGDVTPYTQRKTAIALGSRFISYRIITRDYSTGKTTGLLASEFDGTSNVLYNVSYIAAIPAKAHWFTRYSWEKYGFFSFIEAEIWMIFHLVVGLFCAVVMLVVGTVIGTVMNPIDTLTNLTFSPSNWQDTNLVCTLWDLARAVVEPLLQTFWWSPGYWGETVTVTLVLVVFLSAAGKQESAEAA